MDDYADPFLIAHNIRPFWFDIGGGITPISIRDQAIRGRIIVNRAVETGLVGTQRRLLVVGAGVAGAAAAMHAARLGIETRLVEREKLPFCRQRGCLSRWIDPTQYDWPADHWTRGTYLTDPLKWRTNRAHLLAQSWRSALERHQRLYNLEAWHETRIQRVA